jgi:hypothetical protein
MPKTTQGQGEKMKRPDELTDAELQAEWEGLMQTEAAACLTREQGDRLRILEREMTERGNV